MTKPAKLKLTIYQGATFRKRLTWRAPSKAPIDLTGCTARMQVLIALDQLLNTLIPGGWADETLSSRAHRMRAKQQKYWGWTAGAIDKLFFWQADHCADSHRAEIERRQAPPSLRSLL